MKFGLDRLKNIPQNGGLPESVSCMKPTPLHAFTRYLDNLDISVPIVPDKKIAIAAPVPFFMTPSGATSHTADMI
jgi:hypothetical protein